MTHYSTLDVAKSVNKFWKATNISHTLKMGKYKDLFAMVSINVVICIENSLIR